MSVVSRSFSAIGKLVFVGVLLLAFFGGMAGVVYMSLSGEEVKVPDLVGKDFVASETELASLGLKIKKRADRPSLGRSRVGRIPDRDAWPLQRLPGHGDTRSRRPSSPTGIRGRCRLKKASPLKQSVVKTVT